MKNYILAKEFYWVKLEATMPPDYPGVFAHKKYAVFFNSVFSQNFASSLYTNARLFQADCVQSVAIFSHNFRIAFCTVLQKENLHCF